MPVNPAYSGPTPRRLSVLALLCLSGLVGTAQAQEAGTEPPASDPTIVVMRTVHPRIAYRGVPNSENPIRAEATTFPSRVFDEAVDVLIDNLVGDRELGERGAASPAIGAMLPLLERSTTPLGSTLAGPLGSGAPLGAAASTAGAVGGATRNLGSIIGGALAPAVETGRIGGGP